MSEHDQQVSGVEATANPAPSTGRRRFTKGVLLATPAVMTLMSGRLAAADSVTCLQKWIDNGGNPDDPANPPPGSCLTSLANH
jgi:hypothetical protein